MNNKLHKTLGILFGIMAIFGTLISLRTLVFGEEHSKITNENNFHQIAQLLEVTILIYLYFMAYGFMKSRIWVLWMFGFAWCLWFFLIAITAAEPTSLFSGEHVFEDLAFILGALCLPSILFYCLCHRKNQFRS